MPHQKTQPFEIKSVLHYDWAPISAISLLKMVEEFPNVVFEVRKLCLHENVENENGSNKCTTCGQYMSVSSHRD